MSDSVSVATPASFALAYVATYVLECGNRRDAYIALRFPLPSFPITGLTVEKLVALKLNHGPLGADKQTMTLAWDPVGTAALPGFEGTLRAEAEGENHCRLRVDGGYTAPGGTIGRLFDGVLGVRIARATLSALLADLKTGIEADYHTRLVP